MIITTVNDIRTYIANHCGGDDEVQTAMYDRVHSLYMSNETPLLGRDWSEWFDEHGDAVYELACSDVTARGR